MRMVIEDVSDKRIVLEMKSWRKRFSDTEIKELIATVLNRTICETNTRLKGYFISDWRIYLVLHVGEQHEREFIDQFLIELDQILTKHYYDSNDFDRYLTARGSDNTGRNLFRFYDFFDARLYLLLIGENSELTYSDEKQEEMKTYLTHYKYASYRNYRGEKGPVIFPLSKRRTRQ